MKRSRRALVLLALYGLVAPALLLYSFRASGGFRVELGAADDESYRLGNPSAWGRPYQDQGPLRLHRGVRRMTHFAARTAFVGAGVVLPAVVTGGDAELRLRMHRYAQPGVVRVFANGIELGGITFVEDSYPWDIRRLRVPASLLDADELRIELQLEETGPAPGLPPNAIAALDFIELAPGEGARLVPTASQWAFVLALPLALFATLWWARARVWWCFTGALVGLAATSVGYSLAPGSTSAALSHLWLAFPLGFIVWLALRALAASRKTSRTLSAAFVLILLAHSTVIFWPQHLPPDVRAHTRQLQRLASSPWTKESLKEIASSYGKEGRTLSLGREHPEAEYVAPYSPVTYLVIHAARAALDRPRFLLEYLAVVAGAVMVLLAFAITRAVALEPAAAGWAFAIMTLEISTWHHAARSHTPAVVGQMMFMAAVAYLVARYDELSKLRVAFVFALLSFAATLSYSATMLHFALFIAWLVALDLFDRKSIIPSPATRRLWIASVAGTLASVAVFYRHFLGTGGRSLARLAPEGYRAPAAFFFLRNQVRDTVRILNGGYPLWVLVALPAYVKLREWTASDFARRVVWAWTATYLTLLVAKDPLLFPELFLQVKEDLLYAGLLAVLGGMTLQWTTERFARGKWIAGLVLALMLAFQVSDYVSNADTIHPRSSDGG